MFQVKLDYDELRTVVVMNDHEIWYGENCTAKEIHDVYDAVQLAADWEMSRSELCSILALMKTVSPSME